MQFGKYLTRGVETYFARFGELALPMALLTLALVLSYLCFCLPSLIVGGPLIASLFMVGLAAVRGQPVEDAWRLPNDRVVSAFVLGLLFGLAGIVMTVVMYAGMLAPMFLISLPAAVVNEEPSPAFAIPAFGLSFVTQMLMMAIVTIGSLLIATKTMFTFPLIVDRGLSPVEALKTSWRGTEGRLVDLALTMFIAWFIGSLGAYACYVGMLLTFPVTYTIVAAAYIDVFDSESSTPPEAEVIEG